MLHNDQKIKEIVELLKTASKREVDIALAFIRSLIRK